MKPVMPKLATMNPKRSIIAAIGALLMVAMEKNDKTMSLKGCDCYPPIQLFI